MLGSNGVINEVLTGVGLIDEPLKALLYNRNAVVVTLIYVWIPFATLPILACSGASTSGSMTPPPTCTAVRFQQSSASRCR